MPKPSCPEVQTCSVEGRDFPFVEYNPDQNNKPPLVLLAGLSMQPTHWFRFPNEVGRHVIALGIPAGKDAPAIPTMGNYAKAMTPAVHELVGPQRYDLLGLSWGGILAQQIAVDDRSVRRLVVAGSLPAVPVPYLKKPSYKNFLETLTVMSALTSTKRSPEKATQVYGGDFRNNPELALGFAELTDRQISHIEHVRQLLAASSWGSLLPLIMQRSLQKDPPETLFMAGDDDPITPHSTVKLGAWILGMELETIPNGGHGFLLTRPEESGSIVRQFLDRSHPADKASDTVVSKPAHSK